MNNNKSKPHITCLMMVKNEHLRLPVTLKSIEGVCNSIVVYDTGSTDDTISILKNWSKKTNIPLYLKEGQFENFSTSRNVSLDFVDTFDFIDFVLLLDVNDELRGGDTLLKYANEEWKTDTIMYLTCQEWKTETVDKYYNVRFIKPRNNLRYVGVVHEYMKDMSSPTGIPSKPVKKMSDTIVVYQDRTQDDDKSKKRFIRDRELLLNEYKRDPTDSRTHFYLAQTCGCLQQHEEAIFFYKLRLETEGFQEEKFHSYLRIGDSCVALGQKWEDVMKWYILAFEHSDRVEPLVKLADHYIKVQKWYMAYMYLHMACELEYPHHCILFVDRGTYDYARWFMMGIVGFYVNKNAEGKIACQKAIESGINIDVNKNNLQFYLKKEQELKNGDVSIPHMTKTEYIKLLKSSDPNMSETKGRLLWKKYQQKHKTV